MTAPKKPSPQLNIRVANTFPSRLRGLLFRPQMEVGEGLLLAPCSSIHTFFMRYEIDVVFLDRSCCVRKIVPHVKPWRAAGCRGAYQVLELPGGAAQVYGLAIGEQIGLTSILSNERSSR